MSGFVGILHLDSSPVDRLLVQRMTDRLAFRGPDSSEVHIDGALGLGHTLLRTLPEARQEQPCSLDGEVWIVSDARIDGRAELLGELRARGRDGLAGAPDVELILHAYAAWGEECARHLIGDFSFAIWDRPKQRLFCARDPFGVRPFYYAHLGDCLIFSNTLECVRSHPSVSDTLNEQFIGDFLLFGRNNEPATTVCRDIQRLPGAHALTCSAREGLKQARYWSLPTDGVIRYRRPEEYAEHFSTLFQTAIQDRIRTDSVALFMSGGLDSSAIAAIVRTVLPEPGQVRAFTTVYDRLMPDRERHYSGLVSQALNIPIQYQVADDYVLFERCDRPGVHTPEPTDNPMAALQADSCYNAALHSRVAFTGFGGDPTLYPSKEYFLNLIKSGRAARFALDIAQYRTSHGRFPPLFLRSRLRRWMAGKSVPAPPYPAWLNQDFAQRLRLAERWKQIYSVQPNRHPCRPEAYNMLSDHFWNNHFEGWDAGSILQPMEVVHPFFDTRLVNYLLAIPPVPYCADKAILRSAMQGLLPDAICRRPKTPLIHDPLAAHLGECSPHNSINLDIVPEIEAYVDTRAVPAITGGKAEFDRAELWLNLRPRQLSDWLRFAQNSSRALAT